MLQVSRILILMSLTVREIWKAFNIFFSLLNLELYVLSISLSKR